MLTQTTRAGVHLPSYFDLEESQEILPEQLRPAPKLPDGKVDMEAWRALRKEALGASDVACLTGTEYATRGGPYTLYQSMKGLFEKKFDNEDALRFGHYAEVLADMEFAHVQGGLKLVDPEAGGIRWRMRERMGWARENELIRFVASLDRVLFLDQNEAGAWIPHNYEDICKTKQWVPVEVKNVGRWMADEWGTSYIPDSYYDQVQGQLLATGKHCAIVIAIVGGNQANFYTVPRDEKRQKKIADAILRFLERLDADDVPAPGAGEMDTQAVKEATKEAKKGKVIKANPEIVRHAMAVLEAQGEQKEQAALEVAHKNCLRLEMGEATKCEHELFTVYYGPVKGQDKVEVNQESADADPLLAEAKRVAAEAKDAAEKAAKIHADAEAEVAKLLAPHCTVTPTSSRQLKVVATKPKLTKEP